MTKFKKLLIFVLIFSLGGFLGFALFQTIPKTKPLLQKQQSPYQAFVAEIYDKVKENYWDNVSDSQLIELFKLAFEKATGKPQLSPPSSKDELLKIVSEATSGMNEEQKKKFVVDISAAVLASLNPPQRSGLFTQKQEEQLKNRVENINPEKDLYKDLGLTKGASEAAVAEAYKELAKTATPQKLKELTYAKETLTQKDRKEKYDKAGIEPTIFTRLIAPNILYLQFKKFSPTSLEEFQKAFDTYKEDASLASLIFDLRGNVGGAIDATAYFLGYFIGKNQYAFDFYKKGVYIPFKTQTDKLSVISKFKQVVILVDKDTQSSAEMMAASLKKYHAGVVVGVPTRGWGTVERVFPLDNQISQQEKYSLFLVHSITLRDDNLPIEGRGVEPNVNIKDDDWEQQLFSYFRNPVLTETLKEIVSRSN